MGLKYRSPGQPRRFFVACLARDRSQWGGPAILGCICPPTGRASGGRRGNRTGLAPTVAARIFIGRSQAMSSPWRQLFGQTTVLELGARGVRRRPLATMAVICTSLAATIGYAVSAQGGATPQSGQAGGPPVYDPYPPGVLPPRPCGKAMFKSLSGSGPEARLVCWRFRFSYGEGLRPPSSPG